MSVMMTVKDVAERLKCSESFVYGLLASGELMHYRLGRGQGGIRVSDEHLGAYLKGKERGGRPKPEISRPAPRPTQLKHLSLG